MGRKFFLLPLEKRVNGELIFLDQFVQHKTCLQQAVQRCHSSRGQQVPGSCATVVPRNCRSIRWNGLDLSGPRIESKSGRLQTLDLVRRIPVKRLKERRAVMPVEWSIS